MSCRDESAIDLSFVLVDPKKGPIQLRTVCAAARPETEKQMP